MMGRSKLEASVADPLCNNFELPLTGRFYPLGFTLDIETNSPVVLQAAFASWGKFSPEFEGTPVSLSIAVSPSSGEGPPGAPSFRARQNLLSIVSDAENFIVCDFNRAFGYGWVTEDAVKDSVFFRYYFLDAAALVLLNQANWAPVHGALVQMDGRGVLLCGETCAGKSTLAYACARSGWTFISDDGTFLPRQRGGRFGIGNPHVMRFREDAPGLFPELKCWMSSIRANGKVAIEIPTAELPGIVTASGCHIDHIVFLNRTARGNARLAPYQLKDVVSWFERCNFYGMDAVKRAQNGMYQELLCGEVWELDYQDLESAVARLKSLIRDGY